MIKNEMDVLPAFLAHVDALFDTVVFIDHGSLDGTAETLAWFCNRGQRHLWRLDTAGYFQEAATLFSMRWLFENTDSDVVTVLDADEFIDVRKRERFCLMLQKAVEEKSVGLLEWNNCIPENLNLPLCIGDPIWKRYDMRRHVPHTQHKIAVPRCVFDSTFRVVLGNHAGFGVEGNRRKHTLIGQVMHFPLRSVEQMRRKYASGALPYVASGGDVNSDHHWIRACQNLAIRDFDENDLVGSVENYTHFEPGAARAELHTIQERGFMLTPLLPAHNVLPSLTRFKNDVSPWRVVAATINSWHLPLPTRDVEVHLSGNTLTVKL